PVVYQDQLRCNVALSLEVRSALRTLRLGALFTLVTAGTLALGIAAVTAVFAAVNAVYLKPLPYPQADRLVNIWSEKKGEDPHWTVSPVDYFDWKTAQAFERL